LRGWFRFSKKIRGLDLVRKYLDLVRKYVEGVRYKSQTQIRLRSLWRKRGEPRKEENQEKRELVESCNHQSKVRVRLIFSNLRLYNSETEFIM